MRSTFYILMALVLVQSGCAVRSVTPGDTMEINMDFDLSSLSMRHGWAFMSGPAPKYTGNSSPESIARGKKLFQKNCQKCHGPSGKGDGPLAKKLNIKPANLQKIGDEITNTYILVQINNGKGDMPRWKDYLTQEETVDLTAYIRSLKTESDGK